MVKVALKALLLFDTLMTLVATMIGFEEEEYEDEVDEGVSLDSPIIIAKCGCEKS